MKVLLILGIYWVFFRLYRTLAMKAKLTTAYIKALDPLTCDKKHYDSEIKGFYLQVNKLSMTFFLRVVIDGKEGAPFKIGRYGQITAIQARELAKNKAGEMAKGINIQEQRQAARRKADNEKKTTLKGYIDNVYGDHLITELKTGEKILKAINSTFKQWHDKQLTDINVFWSVIGAEVK